MFKPYILINDNNESILRDNVYTLGENVDSLKQMKGNEREMKVKYMSAVLLMPTEYEKLIEKFGEKKTLDMIENLDYYIGSKGKQYKSHYMTILSWDKKDRSEKKIKEPTPISDYKPDDIKAEAPSPETKKKLDKLMGRAVKDVPK